MSRPSALLFCVLSATGCATGSYDILSGTRVPTPSVGAAVVLYGVEGVGNPPPGCRTLGSIRAWSYSDKTLPYDQLRAAATELGGDAVVDIHPDPAATDRKRPTLLATVARCGV
jgi:hypothetical protein